MVLPLLGLLGLAAGSGALPHVQNYQNRTRGKYNASVMEGVDQSNPAETRNALFGGGLLTGAQFQGDSRTAFEGQAGREQSDRNSRRSAGVSRQNAIDRLQFDKDRYANSVQNPDSPNYGKLTPAQAAAIDSDQQRIALEQEKLLNLQQREAQERQAAIVDQKIAYTEEAQPLVNLTAQQDWAIDKLENPTEDMQSSKWLLSEEGLKQQAFINQTIEQQKMAFFKRMRDDAPGEVDQQKLDEMFPLLTADTFNESKTRSLIAANLRAARQEARNQLETMKNSFEAKGIEAPNVAAQTMLPEGWGG